MFDYIIVGAGSAGCVLANRLSADPGCRVLLLEAGGPDADPAIPVPAYYTRLQDSPSDWADRTVPQPGLNARRIFVPQGRTLGGSSAINYLIYIRGHRADYDAWALAGNAGWGYDGVLPYFIRAEHNEAIDDRYHGRGGPIRVSSHPPDHPLVQRYFAAARTLGLRYNPDFNGAEQEGYGPLQATRSGGARCSTAAAYLHPVSARANLTVLTHAHVTRLRWRGPRAVGVDFLQCGMPQSAEASAEVILSAGAFRSPQLLLLSGIGPADDLSRLGIAVRSDLPGVGRNLQDHLHTRVRCEITQPLAFGPVGDGARLAAEQDYALHGRGPLTSNLLEAGAFVRSAPDETVPGLQLFLLMTLSPEYPEAGPPDRHGITLTSYINRPESRGRVTLASADPLDRPRIDPAYLSAADDLRCALAGVRWNRDLLYTAAFDDIRGREVAPGVDACSDAALEDFVRRTSSTTWHPAGTCKMGHDDAAVVDDRLRVHGLEGLRVVDASIMPTIVGGNTNAPVIMIAEKAADLIRADAGSA